ncbi:MAG: chloride channel protein [Ilumatobacteraceae bacterium]
MRFGDVVDRTRHIVRWAVLATLVGLASGALSAAFIETLGWAGSAREARDWLVWLLPVAGLAVGCAYHYGGRGLERGSNLIIEQIHEHRAGVPLRLSPLIFAGSTVSHLFGASVGRAGAALQLAAGVSDPVGRRLGLDARERSMLLVTAVAGGFGSVFGVPVTGAVFALEVQRVGRMRYEAIVPAFVASLVGDATVRALGIEHTAYPSLPSFTWSSTLAWEALLLGIAAGLVATAFVALTHGVRSVVSRCVAWYPARPMVGGAVVAALVLVFGWRDNQGLSVHLAQQAFAGSAAGQWPVKPLLTAISVGSGFVGGEVTPMLVTGALLGASLGSMLGANVALFAMVGAVAVLAAAANTPLACVFLGVELFGGSGAVLFAVACATAYACSGQKGLYHAQPVSTDKSGRPAGRTA